MGKDSEHRWKRTLTKKLEEVLEKGATSSRQKTLENVLRKASKIFRTRYSGGSASRAWPLELCSKRNWHPSRPNRATNSIETPVSPELYSRTQKHWAYKHGCSYWIHMSGFHCSDTTTGSVQKRGWLSPWKRSHHQEYVAITSYRCCFLGCARQTTLAAIDFICWFW